MSIIFIVIRCFNYIENEYSVFEYKVFEKVGTRFILCISEFKWVTRVDVFLHVIGATCLYEDVNMFSNFYNLPRPVGENLTFQIWPPLFHTKLNLHHFQNN